MQILIDFGGCQYTVTAVIENAKIIEVVTIPDTTIKVPCHS